MDKLKKGDRIQVSFWGEQKKGVVLRNQVSSVVFVTFDGETTPRWFHASSLSKMS